MKILVICQYYYPEPFRIKDICEEMVRRGHKVTVVAGVPNYPEGITYKGFENGKKRDEVINGVRVHRCFTVARKSGAVRRFLNYYSYVFSAGCFVKSKACVPDDRTAFDVIFVNQLSPVMMGKVAMAYKKKHKVPAVMYCLDLWPESLVAGGITRGSAVYKLFHKISGKIYRSMDKILVTSRSFASYLCQEFGIELSRIDYLPQYAEGIFDKLSPKKESDTFDFMFAGNLGAIQSVDTILKAAQLLVHPYPNVRFHIVGGGTDLNRLKCFATENSLGNVIFYGRRQLEEMPDFYKKADAMLITLKSDSVISMTLPGKIQSYMAAGKPIIGAIDCETKEVINSAECGFCGKAEDSTELAENIKKFMDIGPQNRAIMGSNARAFYEEHFEQNIFMDKLESYIELYDEKDGD